MRKIIKLFGGIGFMILMSCEFALAVTGEQVYFYHTDPAGTPLAISDSGGNVVWRADYKPFGEEQSITNNGVNGNMENTERFVGKEKDKESGLSYFGARYMQARIGRFVAPDPVGAVNPWSSRTNEALLLDPQRLNRYAYGLNNPNRYVDPDGRDVYIQNTTAVGGWHRRIVVDTPLGPYGQSFGMSRRDIEMNGSLEASGNYPLPGGFGSGVVYSDNIHPAIKEVTRFVTSPREDALIESLLKNQLGNTGMYHYITNSCRTYSESEFNRMMEIITILREEEKKQQQEASK